MQLFSQSEESIPDVSAENWLAGSFTYSTKNNLKISLQEQIRMVYGSNPFDRILSELQIEKEKKIKDIRWSNGWGLRHYLKRDRRENIDSLSPFFRYHLFSKIGIQIQRWSIYQRVQYQRRREHVPKNNEIGERRRYWRFKTGLGYNFKNWKLDPEISSEFFIKGFDSPNGQDNKVRFSLGTKKKISNNFALTFKYMFEKELKTDSPNLNHIVAIRFQIKK